MSSYTAITSVPTIHASRYLQQLCKHWQHSLSVEFTAANGTIIFPKDGRGGPHPGDAQVKLEAAEHSLHITIDATSIDQLEGLKRALAHHLERFAFRELPLEVDWSAV